MKAIIFQPSKTAMQSGRGHESEWVLEYEPLTDRRPEPLMGWVASGDTLNQVRLRFPSLHDAVSFAKKKNMDYSVRAPHTRRVKPRNYGDNFKYVPEEEGRK